MHNTLLERLQALLKRKKSRKFYAQRLGISEQEVVELMNELRQERRQGLTREAETSSYISALEDRILEHDFEKGTLKSSVVVDQEPKTIEELYAMHKVNPEKYKITNYWSKLKSSGKFTSSIFAKAKEAKDYTPEEFLKFLETYNPGEVIIQKHNIDHTLERVDAEISIADFHLSKKTIEEESLGSKKELYLRVLTNLLYRASGCFNIDKLVFVISNDFFHTDTYSNTTTAGTPQETITDFSNEYEEGFDLLVNAIYCCSQQCDSLEVVLVQGNHDRTKSFYLAHALEVYFKNHGNISFQRHHSTTKHVVLGNTFIGYHHGNCKIDDLPLLFATGKTSEDFGKSKYREVHTGDKHYYMAKEVKGVRVQQMPSLSGTDRWHLDNNYVHNIRAALMLVYDKHLGKIGEFEERI